MYGQMSLWGATVITNLMSAIPWVGQDIVESKNITEYSTMVATALSLPTIGQVSVHALKKGNKIRSSCYAHADKKEYLSIPSSFIAFLVGFIDGDGYIQVTRTPKGFITIKLVISIHLDDISTLQYIHSVLKFGKITIYPDIKNPRCKLIINRTDLQEVFFPLLLHHGIFFLTDTRRAQFDLAMSILKEDKKVYDEIPTAAALAAGRVFSLFELPQTAEGYAKLGFFKHWIVGFVCASLYPGVVEFAHANPLNSKKVKKDFKKLCSNRESYLYLNRIYFRQRKINPLFNHKHSSTGRLYSTFANKLDLQDKDFYDWLCGLVDGEGSFQVQSIKDVNFAFSFNIALHIDDRPLLLFIHSKLGCGKVTSYKDMAYFRVFRQIELKIIIDLFNSYPLNTTKHLNFLSGFKKAFELYTKSYNKTLEVKQEINSILTNMNRRRSDYEYYESRVYRITPYWLLGFVEGEGSFYLNQSGKYRLTFSISQSARDLALLEESPKTFLHSLRPGHSMLCYTLSDNPESLSYIYEQKGKNTWFLQISDTNYIKNILIPLFDSLVWHSKKELDYIDWKSVLKLKELGQHYTEEGLQLIALIFNQMNSRRLSSNPDKGMVV